MRCAAFFLTLLGFASAGFSQIIYEPVQYQYGTQTKFYYGGSDPRTLHSAAASTEAAAIRNGNVSPEPERVYTDAIPFQNARIYGFTAGDARNEAYANVPTYFRKADLLNAAVATPGAWIVPAQAQSVIITPSSRIASPPTTRPATIDSTPAPAPRPLLIIPKKAFEPVPADATRVAERD